jgi:hypothetical protein
MHGSMQKGSGSAALTAGTDAETQSSNAGHITAEH